LNWLLIGVNIAKVSETLIIVEVLEQGMWRCEVEDCQGEDS
jgi:hypothetical protein